jgi:hypothetical protein
MPVLSRLIKVSALVLGAGLVVAGCSPVKLGAAAVVGNERITVATLNNEVTNLSRNAKLYPGTVQLTQAQETQETLTWLVRFKINDALARQAGITVTQTQSDNALNEIYNAAASSAKAQGIKNVSINLILTANGIPANLRGEVGRYQAIDDQFLLQANGGKAPATQAQDTTVNDKLNKARCVAAKQLNIQVNPQYGRLDYTQYSIVASTSKVTRSAGPAPTASPTGVAPAC